MPVATVNQQQLYYEIHGSGEPVILLHGLGSSCQDWSSQTKVLQSNYQVIAVDLRGHGQSSKPSGPYTIKALAQDIECFLDTLGIQQCHIIGISMGGMIAFQLAVDHPDRLWSFTAINSGPHLVVDSWKMHVLIKQRLLVTQLFGMRATGWLIMRKLFPKPQQQALRQSGIEKWAKNNKAAYLSAFKALINWSVEALLNNIKCPVLILASDHDYTPISMKAAYCQQIPNATLVVIENSGHASPLDQPEQVNQALLHFLKQHQHLSTHKKDALAGA